MSARFLRALFLLSLLGLASGCRLNRSPIGSPSVAAQWSVEPAFFCPGDPVTVSWDLTRMPRSPENCRPRNGGFDAITACASSTSCPSVAEGAACLDGFCCRRDVFDRDPRECPVAAGCYPDFNLSVNADTMEPPVRDENRSVSGTRMVTPAATTEFTFTGFYNPPLVRFEGTQTVRMVTLEPPTRKRIDFPFACVERTWNVADFDRNPISTERVIIAGLRNTSGHTIVLASSATGVPPVTLRPDETTEVFNGRIRGLWTARLADDDPARLTTPRCDSSTRPGSSWPDLNVLLTLQCAAP